jgi:hypothetical protein
VLLQLGKKEKCFGCLSVELDCWIVLTSDLPSFVVYLV